MWSFSGEFDPTWLTQPVSLSDHLASYVPLLARQQRSNLEGWRRGIQADLDKLRDEVEELWKEGDELWAWHHRYCYLPDPVGRQGLPCDGKQMPSPSG